MRLIPPIPNARISQRFGEHPAWYAPYGLAGHEGLDLAVPTGTPVFAAHDGTATVRLGSPTYGHYVTVQSEQVDTLYAHLSRVDVAQGQAVAAGDIIGLSGNTGRSFGAHLHFGVRLNPIDLLNGFKGWVDPERFLGGEEEEGNLANIIGWHIGNGNAPTDTDWRILEAVPPKCIVFLPDEGTQPAHIERLLGIAPGCHIIMRPYYHPGAPLQEYIDQCKRAMDKYWPVVPSGQRHMQPFNEPNMPKWAQWEGFGDQPEDMQRWDDAFCAAYSQIKRHDERTLVGGPALTPGNRDAWFKSDPVGHYYLHGPSGCYEGLTPTQAMAARGESLCAAALSLMDEHYAHVYIHEGRDAWSEPWRGLRFERYRQFVPDKPLWITECGFPNRALWPDWGDAAIVDWLGALRTRNVEGVAWWILGDKEQWGRPWYENGGPRPLVWTLGEWQRESTPQPIAPSRDALPEDETATDAATLKQKVRWWFEEYTRQVEAGNTERARAIRYSLISLMYRSENAV